MNRFRKIFGAVLMVAGFALGGYLLLGGQNDHPPLPPDVSVELVVTTTPPVETIPPTPSYSPQPPTLDDQPDPDEVLDDQQSATELPEGKLIITNQRKAYISGNIMLLIPVIELEEEILEGTETSTLAKGPGLYEYSQLPGFGNPNVSIAAHRDARVNGVSTDDAPFFYIDLIQEGDYIYLYDSEHIYRYVWESSYIVEPSDWDPIRTTDYSCVTLTSCHPIGVNTHRIVVRGRLDKVFSYSQDYEFIANAEEAQQ